MRLRTTSPMGAKLLQLIDGMDAESLLCVYVDHDAEPYELALDDKIDVDSTHLTWSWGIAALGSIASAHVVEGSS